MVFVNIDSITLPASHILLFDFGKQFSFIVLKSLLNVILNASDKRYYAKLATNIYLFSVNLVPAWIFFKAFHWQVSFLFHFVFFHTVWLILRIFNIVEFYRFIHHKCSKYCMYKRGRKNISIYIYQYITLFLTPKLNKNFKTFKFIHLRILTCTFVYKYYDISYVNNRCIDWGLK